MKNNNNYSLPFTNVTSLEVVGAPATIPPAPASGVFVTAPKAAKDRIWLAAAGVPPPLPPLLGTAVCTEEVSRWS